MLVEQQQPRALLRYTPRTDVALMLLTNRPRKHPNQLRTDGFPVKKKERKSAVEKKECFHGSSECKELLLLPHWLREAAGACLRLYLHRAAYPSKAHRDQINSLIRRLGSIREVFGA